MMALAPDDCRVLLAAPTQPFLISKHYLGECVMRVIARAYGNRPLDRVVVGRSAKLVYIANPSTLSSTENLQTAGVGFPTDCIFKYHAELLAALCDAWDSNDDGRLYQLWARCEPFALTA